MHGLDECRDRSPVMQSGYDEPEEMEEAIADELMLWRQQAKDYNNQKMESRQAWIDAYNKRTDAYNRRTDILNQLLNALQNKD